jgi:hypothetical protein
MGNAFVHIDLTTTDRKAAQEFYGKVFDWKFRDMPQMEWTGIDVGKGVGGGISKQQMPQQPIAWTAYVDVADVKKSLAKASAAGATVVQDYMEVPGANGPMGALGVFIDPQGAAVGVWQQFAQPKPARKPAKKAARKAAKKPAKKAKKGKRR